MKIMGVEVVREILGAELNYAKVLKLTEASNMDISDLKACIAVLNFVFSNAAKYDAEVSVIGDELQQLGLPKEHASAIVGSYSANRGDLRAAFLARRLQLPKLKKIDWRVDYVLGSSTLKEVNEPSVQLRIDCTALDSDVVTPHAFEMTYGKLGVLLQELKTARGLMDALRLEE
mmetsp:Transcript_34589/g.86916  ORF Transcript_34589/g.86916 Transcript_34589/m.86916 type:complete len:174 (-) Transcript_34589:27-548(-)